MLKLKGKKVASFVMAVVLTVSMGSANIVMAAETKGTVKNIIMMVPDGMSVSATTLARYQLDGTGQTNLEMDQYMTALVKTTWANGPVTDSAPAGTAYATGVKSLPGALGIDAKKTPKASILEAAQLQGKATGLIATSEWMHATPAAFSAHEEKRSNYANIAEQMLNQNIDVLLGTGSAKTKDSKNTATYFDILGTAKAKGYTVVENKTQMNATKATKVWADFTATIGGKNNMSYDMDRNAEEPSLEDMTKKAIELLSKDKDGFFLMVEGSKIDWAAHANDTIGIVGDTLAFDKAFKAAVDFAKKDGNTVVISVTDHGNSGISIGSYGLESYDKALFSILDPVKKATKSAEGAMALLKEDKSNANEVLKAYGIDPADESKNAVEAIATFKANPTMENLVKTMAAKAYIGYTTDGHTGEDVPLYIYAPETIKVPKGLINNTDVASFMADLFGIDLGKTTSQLFVDVTAQGKYNETTKEFSFTGKDIKIKANQSTAKVNGKTVDLEGQVAVYVNGKFYVPQRLLK